MLPTLINDLNVDRIIGDLHQFLTAFPNHTWKNREGSHGDTPLRTVKTILHSLVKLKGNKVIIPEVVGLMFFSFFFFVSSWGIMCDLRFHAK